MPQIKVADGKVTSPDGESIPVKVIDCESMDGLHCRIVIPAERAGELAEALTAEQTSPPTSRLEVAQPGDIPPHPDA